MTNSTYVKNTEDDFCTNLFCGKTGLFSFVNCYHWNVIFFHKVHCQYILVEWNNFLTGTQCFLTQNQITWMKYDALKKLFIHCKLYQFVLYVGVSISHVWPEIDHGL